MEVIYSCQAAPGDRPNDDFVIATEQYVVVLDGATAPAGVDSGCIHDVPWLVAQLGTHLARVLSTEPAAPLIEVLRSGIEATMASHADTCDLTSRDSPSTTVAILRQDTERLEYAVLGDSAVAVEQHDGGLIVGHDDRTSYLSAYTVEAVSQARNTEEGFWVASR